MFEKIPSLKDFIIYFMPGSLTCYFVWDMLHANRGNASGEIAENSVTIFIGIALSFLVGFLLSQIQIIAYSKACKKWLLPARTIEGSKLPADIQSDLVAEVKRQFSLSTADDQLKTNTEIVFLCEHYILERASERTQRFIDRSTHLASFAAASVIPVILGIIDLCVHFKLPGCWTAWVATIAGILVALIAARIMLNFKRGWYGDIFIQFLVLTKTS